MWYTGGFVKRTLQRFCFGWPLNWRLVKADPSMPGRHDPGGWRGARSSFADVTAGLRVHSQLSSFPPKPQLPIAPSLPRSPLTMLLTLSPYQPPVLSPILAFLPQSLAFLPRPHPRPAVSLFSNASPRHWLFSRIRLASPPYLHSPPTVALCLPLAWVTGPCETASA